MGSNWKKRIWPLVLTLVLATGSAGTAQVEKGADPDKSAADVLKSIQLQLRMLDDKVEDVKKRIDGVPDDTNINAQIRRELARALADLKDDMAALRRQVDQLQKDVNSLKATPTVQKSYSAPTTGRIRLVNTYPGPRTIFVNNRSVRLEAGETRILDEPVGRFTYEVMGYNTEPQVRELEASRVFTITVFPVYP